MTLRVVPAISETMAASRRARTLSSEDLPALGGPMMAIDRPPRRRSPRAVVEMGRDLGLELRDAGAHLVGNARWQVLIGEIDRRLEMRHARKPRVRQPRRGDAARHPSAAVPAALLVGLRRDQVGDRLGLGKVELAVLEGAARELAGLGQPAEAQSADRLERALDHGAPAMQVQLGHGLAGLGVGRLEPDDQPAIDRLAAFWIEDGAQRHGAAAPAMPDRVPAAALEGARLGEEDQRLGRPRAAEANHQIAPGCAREGVGVASA